MRPREIGCVLWCHCQNLLDDPRTGKTLENLALYISKAFVERNILLNDVT